MGKINQGILGGFSGKVGTVVGSTWKSINYMRALAVNVHNPNTVKQQCQRGKFKVVLQFCKTITPFLRVGFQEHEHGQSAVNAASSYLLRYAVEGCGNDAALDFDKVRVSQGSLTAAADASKWQPTRLFSAGQTTAARATPRQKTQPWCWPSTKTGRRQCTCWRQPPAPTAPPSSRCPQAGTVRHWPSTWPSAAQTGNMCRTASACTTTRQAQRPAAAAARMRTTATTSWGKNLREAD